MAAGLGLLRLDPHAFWSMTPRELSAALRGFIGAATGDAPLARGELTALMRRYPDGVSSLRTPLAEQQA